MRLDKYIAKAINVTRKEAKELIREGRVRVGGRVVKIPEYKVKEGERVEVEGVSVKPKDFVYIMLYKPKGYISTTEEEAKYPSFLELIKESFGNRKLFSAGRLDVDAEGLLLVTDDGEFAHRVTHPKWKVEKEYVVKLDKPFIDFERLKSVELDGKPVSLVGAEKLSEDTLKVVLTEGRHHIVKRLFKALGYKVKELKRTRIGSLRLDEDMEPGEWRELKEEEEKSLKKLVKLIR
ncbi:pseudouridine synthase [Aquifex pyrophilus]